MLWASGGGGGGYPGVVSNGNGGIAAAGPITCSTLFADHGGAAIIRDVNGVERGRIDASSSKGRIFLHDGIGLFGATPPTAPTTGGAHTAGGTYTATEQAMLNAAYTALRSIGLVT